MALQVSFADPSTKLVVPTAYALIQSITIDAIAQTIDVAIAVYATAAARTAGGTPLLIYHAWPPFASIMSGPVNIPVAAYTYVKSLAIFSGAVDVA